MNSIGPVTVGLGQYLDIFLQASVVTTKAYLRDTKNFLQMINGINLSGKSEIVLVTADVSSLYTIILHDDALLPLNWALSKQDDLPHVQNFFWGQVLDFCLSHNDFWYNQQFIRKKRGVAMGAKFTPSLANLFMEEWEDKSVFAIKRDGLLFY